MIYIDDRINEYPESDIARWTAELPRQRRERVEAIRHGAGRRQSLLSYRLLCRALREEYDITEPPTFTYNEHGKPFLAEADGRNLHFSLSHCREAVCCVVSERPCGIDIECPRRVPDSVIRYAMNEEEQALIDRTKRDGKEKERMQLFLRLWTRKEAVLKLEGTGIRDTMKDVLVGCPYDIETRESDRWTMSIALSKPE
ncbi:MAG: 4'-phosphopantetheinyl transferase superfamily protein [Bacteroidaceae bacterium]|nr:4'-phosphopantetheinyl transferase superfamily protein [Bacteroidaceae bacterium]